MVNITGIPRVKTVELAALRPVLILLTVLKTGSAELDLCPFYSKENIVSQDSIL